MEYITSFLCFVSFIDLISNLRAAVRFLMQAVIGKKKYGLVIN